MQLGDRGIVGRGLAARDVGVHAQPQRLLRTIKDQQRVAEHEVEQGRSQLVLGGHGHGGLDARDVFVGDETHRAAREARQPRHRDWLVTAHLILNQGERVRGRENQL